METLQKATTLMTSMLGLEQEWQNCSPAVLRCVERYGEVDKFLATFSPINIVKYSSLVDRCVNGTAPTLHVVSQAYGEDKSVAWLMMQLDFINNMAGAAKKLTQIQIEVMARNIINNDDFKMLKVTDIMLFCHQFVNGKYGHFYGAVDAQIIGNSLYMYKGWKMERIAVIQREQEHEKKSNTNYDNCITYEEYQKIKQSKQEKK